MIIRNLSFSSLLYSLHYTFSSKIFNIFCLHSPLSLLLILYHVFTSSLYSLRPCVDIFPLIFKFFFFTSNHNFLNSIIDTVLFSLSLSFLQLLLRYLSFHPFIQISYLHFLPLSQLLYFSPILLFRFFSSLLFFSIKF